eukprot:CAMPEP_0174316746 /NCGR_PEP_ID=MMETSP0810-20121108/7159_1 /TAXON_ID=73025 ORGANISM="Eutreptiella gymnastica-like, Strain CCMP1594" /NCGR_SAMPLE_ID=MMETSP0810 /ASSEMBLY_ACC=CAM_ASM_000659 /LENGTH=33 /DNA_ID= /DNA_START= /DNA_END= /DNA_ORIENTATION=
MKKNSGRSSDTHAMHGKRVGNQGQLICGAEGAG